MYLLWIPCFLFFFLSVVILENVDKAWTKVKTKNDNVAGTTVWCFADSLHVANGEISYSIKFIMSETLCLHLVMFPENTSLRTCNKDLHDFSHFEWNETRCRANFILPTEFWQMIHVNGNTNHCDNIEFC